MYRDTKQLLSDSKFYEGYSRYLEDKGRYETWHEAVDRVMAMHRTYYKDKLTPELEAYFVEATDAYKNMQVLGSQRTLQFGGEQLLSNHAKQFNCFDHTTKFITKEGVRSFSNFKDGDEVVVMTHTGSWKKATVRQFGTQALYKIDFKKTTATKTVYATKDHRWLLSDGKETTSLSIGDRLIKEPDVLHQFSWETATDFEKLYWCYGYVYGDGTVKSTGHSMVRLCGKDKPKFESRFLECGFTSSSCLSIGADTIISTGKYKKTLPDPKIDSPELIRAFVRGLMDADGTKNKNHEGKEFIGIQSSHSECINFIRECFPIAGVHIISETDLTGEKTNFGVRPYTVLFTTCDRSTSKYNCGWKVESIEYSHESVVWCLVVEDDHSFVLDGGIVTGNCVFSYADRPAFFGEAFWLLLSGCGVGFSVQRHHVAKLPQVANRTKNPKIHVVDDSIEGWATAVDVLLSSFFENGGKHPEYRGHRVYFDLSKIRPKGAKISGGFKAPGPDGLRLALDRIEHLLQGIVIRKKAVPLSPIQVYDIVMHVSDATLSGGLRRSAAIAIFSIDDEEMATAKTGNWFEENPQRARSNNSALILRNSITRDEFAKLFTKVREFGEPGFIFAESTEHGYNPCVEIGLYPVDEETGKTGWEACNLSDINGSLCDTKEAFFAACRAASILGTLQAGYTNFKFLDPVSKKICDREALIGVSINGWMSNPKVLFDEANMREGAQIVRLVNEEVAKLIGINPAARATTTKPSGNSGVILKTPSGIHPDHAPMYFRNVQMNMMSEVATLICEKNPHMVEPSVWSANFTDYVISFPIVAKEGSLYKDDMLGVKHLEYVKKAQQNWVEYGTNVDRCVEKSLRHNISNTIVVDDWAQVETYLYDNRFYFAGVSLIPLTGDKIYNQSPYTKVLTHEQIVAEYGVGAMFASGLIVDALNVFDNLWDACRYDTFGSGDTDAMKADWARRLNKFAVNYFEGDKLKTEYCLKDVYLLHKWEKIQKTLEDIDWIKELKEKKYIDINTTGAAACSGVSENGEVACLV